MGEGTTQEVIVSQTQGNHTATVKVVHTSRCHVKTSIQKNTECGATCDQMAQVMLNEQTDSDIKRQLPTVVGAPTATDYSIRCESDIVMTVSKGTRYGVTIQKGRQKLEMTMDEWRSMISNADSLEVGHQLLSGTLGVYPV